MYIMYIPHSKWLTTNKGNTNKTQKAKNIKDNRQEVFKLYNNYIKYIVKNSTVLSLKAITSQKPARIKQFSPPGGRVIRREPV